jgi:hypothetical protein
MINKKYFPRGEGEAAVLVKDGSHSLTEADIPAPPQEHLTRFISSLHY